MKCLFLIVGTFFLFQGCQNQKIISQLQAVTTTSEAFKQLINDCEYVQRRLKAGIGKIDEKKLYPNDEHFIQLMIETPCLLGDSKSKLINLLPKPSRICMDDICIQKYLQYDFRLTGREGKMLRLVFVDDQFVSAYATLFTRISSHSLED